jgi:nicotinamidase-related amidase
VADGAVFVYKGGNPDIDSYSAFWDNNKVAETELHSILQKHGVTDVYCTGIAYDYCVGEQNLA